MRISLQKIILFPGLMGLALACPGIEPPQKRGAPVPAKTGAVEAPAAPGAAPILSQARMKEAAAAPAGVRFNLLSRRDPFLNPILLLKRKQADVDEEVALGQPPPGIAGMLIAQVRFAGISNRDGEKTAVFSGRDKRSYFLQEGDRLFDGYLKQINPDSVLFVRETKLKSGKVISQDITKRLRTP